MIMAQLGSVSDRDHFVNADSILNSFKGRIWGGLSPVGDTAWRNGGYTRTIEAGAELALSVLRTVVATFGYLNQQTILRKMQATFQGVTTSLRQFQTAYNNVPIGDRPTGDIDIVSLWDEYMTAFTERMVIFART